MRAASIGRGRRSDRLPSIDRSSVPLWKPASTRPFTVQIGSRSVSCVRPIVRFRSRSFTFSPWR